jgi:uncharacterized protein
LIFEQKWSNLGLIFEHSMGGTMKRLIDKHLLEWKESKIRMPLLIRGARQVGKTYAAVQLGKSFDDFIEINFESDPRFLAVFDYDLRPDRIIRDLGVLLGRTITPGKTLLFFDEIQESENAFKSLRYFYELMPSLHVLAAGSLLDFQISKIGMPVGRVEWIYMYPMSFIEFLYALNHELLAQAIINHDPHEPMSEAVHRMGLFLLREYFAIGGMPAAVKCWRDLKEIAACGRVLQTISNTYKKDFDKYAKHSQIKYLELLFSYIPKRLGKKFKYSEVSQDHKKRELEPALTLLTKAGIVTKVLESDGQGVPLGAQAIDKNFKVIFLDVALSQAVLRLDLGEWLVDPLTQFINKGELVEAFVGQELLAYSSPFKDRDLYYWHRAARGSNAEVDYLTQKDQHVIPLEVKSGSGTVLQSMKLFLDTHPHSPYGIKLAPRNYFQEGKIYTYPLYAVSKVLASEKYLLSL